MLKPNIGGYGTPKFRGENFPSWLSNHEIHEHFLARKFSAMWYTTRPQNTGPTLVNSDQNTDILHNVWSQMSPDMLMIIT